MDAGDAELNALMQDLGVDVNANGDGNADGGDIGDGINDDADAVIGVGGSGDDNEAVAPQVAFPSPSDVAAEDRDKIRAMLVAVNAVLEESDMVWYGENADMLVALVKERLQALAEMPDDLGAIVKECIDELVGNTATDGSPEADASGNEGAESVAVDATA